MSKLSRQNTILEVVEKETISNQEQLRKALTRAGFDVTQATLSRDIHELGLVKTGPGSAQPVAAAIDAEGWGEIVGTVGGDDTILVISQSKKNAHRLATRLRGMLQ